jgi:AraC family transcriptional regulator
VTAWVATSVEDGVDVTNADLRGLDVSELRFPPGHAHAPYDPERGYLAVVLEGRVEKRFARGPVSVRAGNIVTVPANAVHTAEFGSRGARVVVVQPLASGIPACSSLLGELHVRENRGLAALAERMAVELRAPDDAAALAVEGLALELVAAATRAGSGRAEPRRPAWLAGVLELLHEPKAEPVGLARVAEAVGVDASHLARVFRREYGVSVGTYVRRLRLDRAAARLAGSSETVARIAADEGFADQSHFTRAFKRHTGVTPARYRRIAQG